MEKVEAMEYFTKVKQLKEELEILMMDLEQSFLDSTYLYKGVNIFVNQIDFDTGHVVIESCDGEMVFHSSTDCVTSVTFQEFVFTCLK